MDFKYDNANANNSNSTTHHTPGGSWWCIIDPDPNDQKINSLCKLMKDSNIQN